MDQYQKYLNNSLRFLSYRARSEKEVLDYLQKKQSPQEIIEKIIIFLKERRFVNDEEFAANWIEQRLRTKPKALRIIKLELKQKGITQEIIEKVFLNSQFSTLNSGSDLETAKKLVAKKIDRYRALPRQEIYQKLGGFLARKGFDWDTIKKAIDGELKKQDAD